MLYDIYFHNDFDGRAAAAIMLAFLCSRGDDIEHFVPIGYEMTDAYLKENFFSAHKLFKGKKNPAIVVDFAFHPKAAWWFDHHPTTFKREDWKKKFKMTPPFREDAKHLPSERGGFHWFYNPEFESCCAQVAAVLKKEFGWVGPKYFKELVRWGDYLDGANYRSVREVMELTNVGTQVDTFVDGNVPFSPKTGKPFIELLTKQPLAQIAERSDVQRTVKRVLKRRKLALDYHRRDMKIIGKVGFIDISTYEFEKIRFVAYYLWPKLLYAVRILKRSGQYHISLGANPWRRNENHINIGELMKRYGGGGHFGVGAAEFKTKKDAERAAKEIVDYLVAHVEKNKK